jgi:hypothetical protein
MAHMIRWGFSRLSLGVAVAVAGCGSSGDDNGSPSGGTGAAGDAGGGDGGQGHAGGDGIGGIGGSLTGGPYADFPAAPVFDTHAPAGVEVEAAPANAGELFGAAGTGDPAGGPCLIEPAAGTLYPNHWLRPRFRFIPVGKQNLFEIRLSAPNQTNELVVYTRSTDWKMPAPMWQSLATHTPDVPIAVTVRGAELAGEALSGSVAVGTTGEIRIAPVAAAGSIVYWRTVKATNSGELKGFSAGDESAVVALQASQVAVRLNGSGVTCLGCHTSTPDGKFAAFKTLGATAGGALASVEAATTGQAPAFWSTASIQAMNAADFGIPTFSKAHWQEGDTTLLTSWGNGPDARLAWFDLQAIASGEGVSFGFLARGGGDGRGSIMPSWSHDGQTVLYTSTNGSTDGRPTGDPTDLYTVPFGARQGGAAAPVAGAAEATYNEYYPAFSSDDQLIAFNRIGAGVSTYNQPAAEVFVIPSSGGTPTRLAANDPVACSGDTSPGVTNSWPKWAPESATYGNRTYYWLTFSSTRNSSLSGPALPQLYMTAVVVEGATVTTYPALYLWNQPADEANHTPAWDAFDIPEPQIH